MKKYCAFILLTIILSTACSCSAPAKKTAATSKPTQATTEEITTAEPTTVEPTTVKKAEKKKKKSFTKPTEKKEKKSKKTTKPTTSPPTQGKTRPNTHIAVTRPPKGSFSASDFIFTYKKKQIKLNQKIDAVFKLIGDDNSVGELSKKRTEYEYDDFILTTYKEDDEERIDLIEIIGDGTSTSKGAKIGMFATRLKRLYGDPNKLTETKYVYGSGDKTLTFEYENNIVTYITYKYSH